MKFNKIKIFLKNPKFIYYLSFLSAIISLISVIFTISWSFYTNNQFKKLQSAKILLSVPKIDVINNPENQEDVMVNLELAFKNTGDSSAKHLKFKIYQFLSNNPSATTTDKIFDSEIINDIDPGTENSYGSIFYSTNKQLFEDGQHIIYIINLKYIDQLSEKTEQKCFWYKYTLGSNKLFLLLKDEIEIQSIINKTPGCTIN